jgi:predicted extracellular nuclease
MNKFFWLWALPLLALPSQSQTIIGAVQGRGDKSPLVGNTVEILGVVTGDFQEANQLGGFFMQDGGDGDNATSDGIFVYAPLSRRTTLDVQAGAYVAVQGIVEEFNGQTQVGRPKVRPLAGAKVKVPEPLPLNWPLPQDISPERYESMLVKLAQPLTVTSSYELGRYGTLMLSAGGRLFAPGSIGGDLKKNAQENARRALLLDDASTRRSPQPVPYLNALGTRRTGDTVANLTGILTESFEAFRLHPTDTPQFVEANPRPALPDVGGTLKIASFNLHNYFTTLKSQDRQARGAANETDMARQSAKLLAAVRAMNPDILACIELENNGDKALRDFLAQLNVQTNNAYEAIGDPANGLGRDEIRVGLIYKKAKVKPQGTPKSDTSAIFDRAPLAQTFTTPDGATFTVIVNHFKSKGSCPGNGDVDEGEGCWNRKRMAQAAQLMKFIFQLKQGGGSPNVLALGDFNAYFNEAPLRVFREGGLLSPRQSAEDYSFSYDGRAGSLDHAFVTPELAPKVTGVAVWHINSDEPDFLDYSVDKTAPENADYFRSSDHDPLLIGLDL